MVLLADSAGKIALFSIIPLLLFNPPLALIGHSIRYAPTEQTQKR
jgi:hypothetical protein